MTEHLATTKPHAASRHNNPRRRRRCIHRNTVTMAHLSRCLVIIILCGLFLAGCTSFLHNTFDPPSPPLSGNRLDALPELAKFDPPATTFPDRSRVRPVLAATKIKGILPWKSSYTFPFLAGIAFDNHDGSFYLMDHKGTVSKYTQPQPTVHRNSPLSLASSSNFNRQWQNHDLAIDQTDGIFSLSRQFIHGKLVIADSAVKKQKKLIATSGTNRIAAIDPQTGRTLWQIALSNTSRIDLQPVGQQRILISAADDSLTLIDTDRGTIIWSNIAPRTDGEPRFIDNPTLQQLDPEQLCIGMPRRFAKYYRDGGIVIFTMPQSTTPKTEQGATAPDSALTVADTMPQEIMTIEGKKFGNGQLRPVATPFFSGVILPATPATALPDHATVPTPLGAISTNSPAADIATDHPAAAPLPTPREILYTTLGDGSVAAIDLRSKKFLWQRQYGTEDGLTSIGPNLYLFVRRTAKLIALNPADGSPIWTADLTKLNNAPSTAVTQRRGIFTSQERWLRGPIVAHNLLLMAEEDRGNVYLFRPSDGRLLTQYNFGKRLLGVAWIADKLLVIRNNGEITVVELLLR